jgi:hypothetical protein
MNSVRPNRISPGERVGHSLLAICLLAYGAFGLYYDDIYVPGKRSKGIHFHGLAAWIVFGAFLCASLNLIFVAGDHLDSSSGDRKYYIFARATQIMGWSLFVAAIVCQLASIGTSNW